MIFSIQIETRYINILKEKSYQYVKEIYSKSNRGNTPFQNSNKELRSGKISIKEIKAFPNTSKKTFLALLLTAFHPTNNALSSTKRMLIGSPRTAKQSVNTPKQP